MTATAEREIRCKFIAADGAYMFHFFPRPLALEYIFSLEKALRPVAYNGAEDLPNDPVVSRKYARCETIGQTVIYREVIR